MKQQKTACQPSEYQQPFCPKISVSKRKYTLERRKKNLWQETLFREATEIWWVLIFTPEKVKNCL